MISLIDTRFSQMRSDLDGLVQARMESLDSDISTRITAMETTANSFETSTRQQIDLGTAATERTTEHVNNEITEMNAKLDNVNLRLSNMKAQLADLTPTVAQYRTEGIQALQNLTISTGGIRASITDLRQADEQRRQEFRAFRDEQTVEAEARRRAEATLSTRMDSFGPSLFIIMRFCLWI